MGEIVELVREFRFEAAHLLPMVPESHKCRRLHGHSFRGEISVRGEVDGSSGWLIDFAELGALLKPLIGRLDHYYLNEIEGLENPTSETLAIWIWGELRPRLPILYRVTIEETCSSRCNYYGPAGSGAEGPPATS